MAPVGPCAGALTGAIWAHSGPRPWVSDIQGGPCTAPQHGAATTGATSQPVGGRAVFLRELPWAALFIHSEGGETDPPSAAHSLNGCDSQGWSWPKPEARSSVFPMRVARPGRRGRLRCCPRCISRDWTGSRAVTDTGHRRHARHHGACPGRGVLRQPRPQVNRPKLSSGMGRGGWRGAATGRAAGGPWGCRFTSRLPHSIQLPDGLGAQGGPGASGPAAHLRPR